MRRAVRVRWNFSESHEALIPVDELAQAVGVAVAEFTPSLLTEGTTTEELVIVLGRYQDDDSYQDSDTRQIIDAEPGPPPPSVEELLHAADRLLDAKPATTSSSDAGWLLAQLVAAVREQRNTD